jgi:hypothetical protein
MATTPEQEPPPHAGRVISILSSRHSDVHNETLTLWCLDPTNNIRNTVSNSIQPFDTRKNSGVLIVSWREMILAEGLAMSVLYSDAGT